jgi:hypothetical protein
MRWHPSVLNCAAASKSEASSTRPNNLNAVDALTPIRSKEFSVLQQQWCAKIALFTKQHPLQSDIGLPQDVTTYPGRLPVLFPPTSFGPVHSLKHPPWQTFSLASLLTLGISSKQSGRIHSLKAYTIPLICNLFGKRIPHLGYGPPTALILCVNLVALGVRSHPLQIQKARRSNPSLTSNPPRSSSFPITSTCSPPVISPPSTPDPMEPSISGEP